MPLIPLLRHNHHDTHTKKVSKKAEASDGECPQSTKKIGGKRREVSNVEKGIIIAFIVTFGVISTTSSLVGRSWSTVKNFPRRYYKRGALLQTSRPEVLTKRDKRTTLGSVLKNREYIREVRRI